MTLQVFHDLYKPIKVVLESNPKNCEHQKYSDF